MALQTLDSTKLALLLVEAGLLIWFGGACAVLPPQHTAPTPPPVTSFSSPAATPDPRDTSAIPSTPQHDGTATLFASPVADAPAADAPAADAPARSETTGPPQTESALAAPLDRSPRFLVFDRGKVGYIDRQGVVRIPLKNRPGNARFHEGLAASRYSDSRWGYIRADGSPAFDSRFDSAGDFEGGYAPVRVGRLWGIINILGEFSVAPSYERIFSIHEGVAPFQSKGKGGLLDVHGKILVPAKFDAIGSPKDGWSIVEDNQHIFFINLRGETVFDPKEQGHIGWEFSEGLTQIRVKLHRARGKRRAFYRWGYVDRSGKTIITPTFVRAHKFSEGLAAVETDPRMGFMWGYADRTGKVVIAPQWHSVGHFSEGLARVKVGEKFGFINKTGKIVIPARFDNAGDFHDGLARVELYSCQKCQQDRRITRIGYIDASGSYVWKPTPRS